MDTLRAVRERPPERPTRFQRQAPSRPGNDLPQVLWRRTRAAATRRRRHWPTTCTPGWRAGPSRRGRVGSGERAWALVQASAGPRGAPRGACRIAHRCDGSLDRLRPPAGRPGEERAALATGSDEGAPTGNAPGLHQWRQPGLASGRTPTRPGSATSWKRHGRPIRGPLTSGSFEWSYLDRLGRTPLWSYTAKGSTSFSIAFDPGRDVHRPRHGAARGPDERHRHPRRTHGKGD